MRATAVVALLLHALPRAHGAATTFVRVPEDIAEPARAAAKRLADGEVDAMDAT